MSYFRITTHLSEILEESNLQPVIIFKYSSDCGSSASLYKKLEEENISYPIYIVVVQEKPALTKKISEIFEIRHETPQIVIIHKGKVTYTAHHNDINIGNFTFQ
ncbi:MAG: monothiol bacilliredoxin BrxC family protein [Minisyncoccia bacterium]